MEMSHLLTEEHLSPSPLPPLSCIPTLSDGDEGIQVHDDGYLGAWLTTVVFDANVQLSLTYPDGSSPVKHTDRLTTTGIIVASVWWSQGERGRT